MFTAFKLHIDQNFPFLKEKKNLVAFSGGVDSTVLAHLLHRLKIYFALAHCNFKLREKESEKDQCFCKAWAEKLQVPFFTTSFDTKQYALKNKLSTQMAARQLRYDWFKKTMQENRYDVLLTAHHANDNLETFIINLSRGTGLAGLTGISPNRNQIVRPLLPFSKNQIKQYAIKNKLIWREDDSNSSTKYLRNRVRLKIVPELEKLNESFLSNFQQTLRHLEQYKNLLDVILDKEKNRLIIRETNNEVHFDVSKLLCLTPLETYLYLLFSPYGFHKTPDLVNILKNVSGKQLLNDQYRIVKSRNILFLIKNETFFKQEVIIKSNDLMDQSLNLAKFVGCLSFYTKTEVKVDKRKLIFPLRLRKKRDGDIFYPLGMINKKKVSKFFKDQKLALHQKEQVWLLENGDKKIIWIVGLRLDNRFGISNDTRTAITINI